MNRWSAAFTKKEMGLNILNYVRLPVEASLAYQWPESLMVRFCVRKST